MARPVASPPASLSPRRGASRGGSSISCGFPFVLGCAVLVVFTLQMRAMLSTKKARVLVAPSAYSSVNSVSNLRSAHHLHPSSSRCRFYLAESAIPESGLGIFTAVGLHRGDNYIPDICLYVSDMAPPEKEWMHMRTHTFGRGNFFGQNEGKINRAACHGMITNFNTMPKFMINSKIVSQMIPTHAGLHRATSPGAGASTHHFGIHGVALDTVTAGSELTIDYGDWSFDETLEYEKPERPVEWIRENGWCIDNIEVMPATDPAMGRGAFARYPLSKGEVVAPAPLQIFKDRGVFRMADGSEQLYVNYCLQPKGSSLMFFPYGQGVGVINHSRDKANVRWQWSANPMHRAELLSLSLEEMLRATKPGRLILEVVATREIQVGEELYLDYGAAWDDAWKSHVAAWRPPPNADAYVYPADVDETLPLRTVLEQEADPYPANLMTMCVTPDWSHRENGRTIQWYEPEWDWWQSMTYCHILERQSGRNGDPVYTVSLLFRSKDLDFDPDTPVNELYIDASVPRRAIRFVEKPYMDDEHLPGAFRHPLEFPGDLVPDAWLDDVRDVQSS